MVRLLAVIVLLIPGIAAAYGIKMMRDSLFAIPIEFLNTSAFQFIFASGLLVIGVGFLWTLKTRTSHRSAGMTVTNILLGLIAFGFGGLVFYDWIRKVPTTFLTNMTFQFIFGFVLMVLGVGFFGGFLLRRDQRKGRVQDRFQLPSEAHEKKDN